MKRKDRPSSSTKEERKSKKTKKISDVEEMQQISKLDFTSPENLLASLIAPTTTETFLSDYWEKKPLVIHREDSAFYGPLFTKDDFEDILKKEELEFASDVNVCRYEDGDKLYMNGDIGTRATYAQVSKDFKERQATVQFHQPQRFKEILWKFNAHFESIFGCLVGANVYITPPDSQGLAPHHDDVEVFILQLEGKKQWKLYKPPTELPQEYSPDLEQDSIGEPTHEFELQPGDMVYFPRGTVHQAFTPKGEEHSTHITLSTYQQNAWGNLLTNVMSDAIDKAMEADVEFRKGLPLNFLSFMGLGMEGDGKVKSKQEDFNNQVKQLLTRLVDHIDCHESVDKLAVDFMANRLPPIEQKEEAMKDEKDDKPPTEDSEVKLRYPEHVRVSVGEADDIPINVTDDDDESEDDDDEEMSEEEESEGEDEPMEDSDEDAKPKKGKKSQKKSEKQGKKEKQKSKGKKTEKDDEDDDDSDDKKSKTKKKTKKEEKSKKSSSKKGKKKDVSDEEEEEDESEDEKLKKKRKKNKQSKKKSKKEKKSESEDDEEDDDDDASFELGDEDTQESSDDEEEDSDEEGEGPWVFVHHSLNNDPATHMMGPQQPSIIKFPLTFKDAVLHLYRERYNFIPVKSLPLDEKESTHLITSLWSEGLIAVKE